MIVIDTGPLVAVGHSTDVHHAACSKAMDEHRRETFLVSPFVVAETCQLLERRVGPEVEAAFLDSLVGSQLTVAQLYSQDMGRISELVRQYANFPLGVVDASVIALAEREDVETVMTIDQRHFRAVQPLHVPYFNIIP